MRESHLLYVTVFLLYSLLMLLGLPLSFSLIEEPGFFSFAIDLPILRDAVFHCFQWVKCSYYLNETSGPIMERPDLQPFAKTESDYSI